MDPESKELANLFIKYVEWQDVLVAGALECGGLFAAVEHSWKNRKKSFQWGELGFCLFFPFLLIFFYNI